MPLYDYKCAKCGHIFEVQQKISEEPLKYCPNCKGPIKRLISPAGIVFKGSGFHVTDYSKSHRSSVDSRQPSIKNGQTAEDRGPKTGPKETKSSGAAASPKKSK
ncbi:MAG: zinc ribbon domain-containing protein [Candidatus Saganbacteria bacterium]|nr:zinc ribbon domain-containing protein [Candidatus Saganbacteria bacterium]